MSSLPPIFHNTSPPSNHVMILQQTPVDFKSIDVQDERQIDALKENLLENIDQILPRIEQLKEKFQVITTSAEKSSSSMGADILSELNLLQPRISSTHAAAINNTRRIQALSLSQQTVATLSVPKAVKPIHDEFFGFKEEFDASLKNVATLSRSLTQKYDKINSILESMRNIPDNIKKDQELMTELRTKNRENQMLMQNVKDAIIESLERCGEKVNNEFVQKILEAEKLIEELENNMKDGIKKTEHMGEQIQCEKFDMKSSFAELTKELESSMNDRLLQLTNKVDNAINSTNLCVGELQEKITAELDDVTSDKSLTTTYSLIDQIEQEKELSDLDFLLNRLNELESVLQSGGGSLQKEAPEYEDFKGPYNGKTVTYRCFKDGTYKVLE